MADITGMLQAAAGVGGEAVETDPNFNQTVLLLHGDGSNGAQNNTFLDSSSNGFSITRNGNTTQGTFSPFSLPDGRWSNYFDGSGDYLTAGSASDWAFLHNTGATWTLEFWVYHSASGANECYVDTSGGTTSNRGVLIFKNTSNEIAVRIYRGVASSFVVTGQSTGTLTANSWNHVFISYDQSLASDNVIFYINGVSAGTITKTGNAPSDSDPAYSLRIGTYANGSGDFIKGYISNYKISNVVRSVPSGVPTSPYTSDANTEILTCQSNRFVDNSSNAFAITANGDVKVTPFSPFAPTAAYSASVNGGSGYFDGTGDYLLVNSYAVNFPSSDPFTIECWVYVTSLAASDNMPFSCNAPNVYVSIRSTGRIDFYYGSGAIVSSTGAVPANAWTHIAIVRESGGAVTIYANGVSVGTGTLTTAVGDASNNVWIGGGAAYNSNWLPGYISNLRVSDIARYTSGFTPSSAPYSDDANTELLFLGQNAGIFDNTGKNNLETVGNAQVDTTTKKFGTGSMEFDGSGDYLLLPANDALSISANENFTIEFWIYPTSSVANQGIMGTSSTTGIYTDSSGYIYLHNGSVYINPNTANYLTLNTWQHIAIVRSGGNTVAFYKDGVASGSYAGAFDTEALNLSGLNIGRRVTPSQILFTGFIDDLRITRGIARYTSGFTPPTAPFLDQ